MCSTEHIHQANFVLYTYLNSILKTPFYALCVYFKFLGLYPSENNIVKVFNYARLLDWTKRLCAYNL